MTFVNFILLLLIAAIAYALGAVNGAIIVSRYLYRKDIREFGSGNAGMTNMLRTFGATAALLVIVVDVLKSVIAVLLGGWLFGLAQYPLIGKLFAGFCLMLGHIYPVYYGYRGGKGVLCTGTAILLFDWRVGLIVLAVFALTVFFTRYVSLGSVVSAVLFPLVTLFFHRDGLTTILALLAAILIVFKHKENLSRLVMGREPKLQVKEKRKPANPQ